MCLCVSERRRKGLGPVGGNRGVKESGGHKENRGASEREVAAGVGMLKRDG